MFYADADMLPLRHFDNVACFRASQRQISALTPVSVMPRRLMSLMLRH